MNVFYNDDTGYLNLFLDWDEIYDQTSDQDGVCIAIYPETLVSLKGAIENHNK